MRHRLSSRGFSRKSAHRKAMFENLAAAMIRDPEAKGKDSGPTGTESEGTEAEAA